LNLAPAVAIPDDILPMVWILVVNDIELDQVALSLGVTGTTPQDLTRGIATKGKTICIATLAEHGSCVVQPDGSGFIVNALPIEEVVDTTGAGDAFCGTLAACLYSGMGLHDAVRWASVAGSLACTKDGTIDAFAYQSDIEEKLDQVQVTPLR
jgi:ribokinase